MTSSNITLSADQLRAILRYDQTTGIFVWLVRPSRRAFAGDIAGYPASNGYTYITFERSKMFAHRLAWLYVTGMVPEVALDHIDGNRSNNRFANLRLAPGSVNQQNIRAATSKSLSGVLGASRQRDVFCARIVVNRKIIYLGTFVTAEEAGAAYLNAKRKLHAGCTI